MLSVADKLIMLSVIVLNVIMLSVVMLNVIMLSVVLLCGVALHLVTKIQLYIHSKTIEENGPHSQKLFFRCNLRMRPNHYTRVKGLPV